MKTFLFEQETNQYFLVSEDSIAQVDAPSESEARNIYLFGTNLNIAAISMPLKQEKQIIKALPFALEESLGSEIEDTFIKYISKHNGVAYSLIFDKKSMRQLYDETLNKTVSYLPNILPATNTSISILILKGTACVKINEHYSYSIPVNMLEKSIALELKDNPEKMGLMIFQLKDDTDNNQLTIAQLQSLNLPITLGELSEINKEILSPGKPPLNLLSGEFKRKSNKKKASTTKLKLPAYLIAASVLIFIITTKIETSKLEAQTAGVQSASIEFYKKLFPNERVRPKLMKRQFNDAIQQAGGGGASLGFSSLLTQTASETIKNKDITFESMKYNSKNKSLELSLTCKSVGQLDQLKKELVSKGLSVDIASANQSGSYVKGVIKVSNNG
jgi:general secretion pathway protein L